MHPDRPSDLRTFSRPSTEQDGRLEFDPTRVDRVFKQKSMNKRIAMGKALPGQRSKWQQTAAQEIGWFAEPLVPKNPAAQKPRQSCAITQYADNYRLLKHKNPFSRDVHLYRDMAPLDTKTNQPPMK